MGALAFLVTVTYLPWAGGFTYPRWSLIALAVPVLWFFNPGRVTTAHVLGLAFLAYCALSLTWAFNFGDGAIQFGRMVLLALVFCIAAAQKDLSEMWIGAGLGVALNSAIVLAQYFDGWSGIAQAVAPAGTFFNKNIMAETAAVVFAGCLGLRGTWRWLALGALPAIGLCQARGVWAGLTAALIVLIWPKNKFAALALSGCCFLAICYFWAAGYTMTQRVQIWQDTIDGLTIWGRGIGSYWATYPEFATRIDPLALRPENAHNDLLQLIYEVGPATIAICWILWLAFRGPPKAEHYALIVFLVAGLVGFPLYMPATAFLAAAALGYLVGTRVDLRHAQPLIRFATLPGYGHRRGTGRNAEAAPARGQPVPMGSRYARVCGFLLRCLAPVRRSGSRHWRHRGRAQG